LCTCYGKFPNKNIHPSRADIFEHLLLQIS
jgi:hypothetical protein